MIAHYGGYGVGRQPNEFFKPKRSSIMAMADAREAKMVYEMRFQNVDPVKRTEYVKIYRDAVQGCKSAGSIGGHILCSEDDPSAVIVILLWESKEHLARWRGTESYQSFRAAVAHLQTTKSHGGFYAAETI
jgi:heme-degrading monooxygenase HmoA